MAGRVPEGRRIIEFEAAAYLGEKQLREHAGSRQQTQGSEDR